MYTVFMHKRFLSLLCFHERNYVLSVKCIYIHVLYILPLHSILFTEYSIGWSIVDSPVTIVAFLERDRHNLMCYTHVFESKFQMLNVYM